jgi:hypothetical protein
VSQVNVPDFVLPRLQLPATRENGTETDEVAPA